MAVVRPSSRLDEKKFNLSAKALRQLGFAVVVYPGKFSRDAFFASSDDDRSRELIWALTEPGIRAVFVARGGYGSLRTLSGWIENAALMKRLRRSTPRWVIGYSDATYLLHWIFNQLRWMTIHGPLIGFLDSKSLKSLTETLMSFENGQKRQRLTEARRIQGGRAKGRLLGGNLSVLETGGPGALPREPMILCLEDVNENYYQIDRMLWRLIHAGYAPYVRGLLFGKFLKCGEVDRKTFRWERVLETAKRLCRGPILENLRFGHGLKTQRLIRIGAIAELRNRQLKYQ